MKRGTRQGGLTSTLIVNVYEDLVNIFNNHKYGISINGTNYSAFFYADDILLCGTTTSGLLALIDMPCRYINDNGLRFNPTKAKCMIYGKFLSLNILESQNLAIYDSFNYLGIDIFNSNSNGQVTSRIRASQKSFSVSNELA